MNVTKRNGTQVPLDFDKIDNVVAWAAEGLDHVSSSDVIMNAKLLFNEGIKTSEIHDALIKSAISLIDENHLEYDALASRLATIKLRKEVFKQYIPPKFIYHITRLTRLGYYSEDLLLNYDSDEIAVFDEVIQHDRDLTIPYGGLGQLTSKYLVQLRADEAKGVAGQIFETPQFAFMTMAMTTFMHIIDPDERLNEVVNYYNRLSKFDISLPTPQMAGVRTPEKQFSSCVVVETDDSLDSIGATNNIIQKYASQKAGLGIGAGRIRAKGDPVRSGTTAHTGIIPFIQQFMKTLKSCSQGGVRGASASLNLPLWHKEVRDLLVLKNNKGTEFNRARQLDYVFQFNDHLLDLLKEDGVMYLYSPAAVPGMYDAFFEDPELFKQLYRANKHLADEVPAREIFNSLGMERGETARIYTMNVDNVNLYGNFIASRAPIRLVNLCVEITLPTKAVDNILFKDGLVSLCTLGAVNLGNLPINKKLRNIHIEKVMRALVRGVDALLDYQEYPVASAEVATKRYRPLGLGVINLAYYLAKRGLKYSDGSANAEIHNLFEALKFYGMKASMELAEEEGAFPGFRDTKFSLGMMPPDDYKTTVDDLAAPVYEMDWDWMRKQVLLHGLRNSTIMALMPSETSAQVSGATNGIEPPRELISIKASKDGQFKQPVPELTKYRDSYETVWDMPNSQGYLDLVAIMQKWVCQSISANTNWDPHRFPEGKIPLSLILKEMLRFDHYGGKTLYYHNTRDVVEDDQAPVEQVEIKEDDCESGACAI